MIKDQKVERAEITDEEGIRWELGYYVRTFEANDSQSETYGIKIDRSGPGDSTSEQTGGISYSFKEAESLAKKMAAATVTPMSLYAVVDDLMA